MDPFRDNYKALHIAWTKASWWDRKLYKRLEPSFNTMRILRDTKLAIKAHKL